MSGAHQRVRSIAELDALSLSAACMTEVRKGMSLRDSHQRTKATPARKKPMPTSGKSSVSGSFPGFGSPPMTVGNVAAAAMIVKRRANPNQTVMKIFEKRNIVNRPWRITRPWLCSNLPTKIGLKLFPNSGMTR